MKDESTKHLVDNLIKDLRRTLTTISGGGSYLQAHVAHEQQISVLNSMITAANEMSDILNAASETLHVNKVSANLIMQRVKRKYLLKKLEENLKEVVSTHSIFINADTSIPEEFDLEIDAFFEVVLPIFKKLNDLGQSKESITLKLSQQTPHWFFMKVIISKDHIDTSKPLEESFMSSLLADKEYGQILSLLKVFGSKLKVNQNPFNLEVSFFIKGHKINQSELEEVKSVPDDFISSAKILIVEDNALNQLVTKLMVESYGCAVDLAGHGKQAVDMFSPEKYDCVFMDIEMPYMNGIEATRILRERYGSDFPIIGLSADAMGGDVSKHKQIGFSDYLIKPVKKETLAQKIFYWTSNHSKK